RQLRRLRLERRKLGERVFLQGENAIRLTLPSGVVVAGKPDLITLPDGQPTAPSDGQLTTLWIGQPTIYDVKTGRERCSDRIQVMLYMHLAPQALPAYAGTRPAGCIVYNGSKVDIRPKPWTRSSSRLSSISWMSSPAPSLPGRFRAATSVASATSPERSARRESRANGLSQRPR